MPAVLLIMGAAAHLGWVLEFILPTASSPLQVLPGDLYAVAEPHRHVFRGVTWLAGAVFVVATPPLLRISPVHWRGRLTAIAVCVLGVLLLVHATYPPDHPVTGILHHAPQDGTAAHHTHRVTSVLLVLHYMVSSGILLLWWRGTWRMLALAVFLFELLTGFAIGVCAFIGSGELIGLPARMQLVGVTAMLGIGATYVLKIGRSKSERENQGRRRSSAETVRTENEGHEASPMSLPSKNW